MSSSVQQNSSKPTFKKLLARPSKRDSVSKEKFDNKVGAPLPPMRFSLDSDRGEKQVKGKKEGKGSRSLLKVLKKVLPCSSRKAVKKNFETDMDPVVNVAPPVGSRPEQPAIHKPLVRPIAVEDLTIKPVDKARAVAALFDEDEEEERRIAELQRRTEAALSRLHAHQDVHQPNIPQVVSSPIDENKEEEECIAELERRTQAALSRLTAHPTVHRPSIPIPTPQIIVTPPDNDTTEENDDEVFVINKVESTGPQHLSEEALKRDRARSIAQKFEDIIESTPVQPTVTAPRSFPVANVELGFDSHEFFARKQIVLNRVRLARAAKQFEKNPIFQTTNTTVITTASEEQGHVPQSTTITTTTTTAPSARDIKYTYTAPPQGVFYALNTRNDSQVVHRPTPTKVSRKIELRRKVKRAVFKLSTEEAEEKLAAHNLDKPNVPSKIYKKPYNKNCVDAREYLPVYEMGTDGEPKRRIPRDHFARAYMGYIPMNEFKEMPEVVEPLEVRVKVSLSPSESEVPKFLAAAPRPELLTLTLNSPLRKGNTNRRYAVHGREELVGCLEIPDEALVLQSMRRPKPIPF